MPSAEQPPEQRPSAPAIVVHRIPGALRIEQHRLPVGRRLAGLLVEEALALVPVLLPICGTAQHIAALRAIDAARGEPETAALRSERDTALALEQALAVAWRLTVDWPDLLGEARDLTLLKTLRAAPADDLARRLLALLGDVAAATSVSALLASVERSGGLIARVLRRARDAGAVLEPPRRLLRGEALVEAAVAAFAVEPFDPLSPTTPEPIEVGPLAMARDPLVPALRDALGIKPFARFLVSLLDARTAARRLLGEAPPAAGAEAWQLDPGCGLGAAGTARGPVFHRVTLAGSGGQERVTDWRVLAPTDWHFAPGGPIAATGTLAEYPWAMSDGAADDALRVLVASYDPCAPWRLA